MSAQPGRRRDRSRERRLRSGSLLLACGLLAALPVHGAVAPARAEEPGTPVSQCQVTDPRLAELSGLVVAAGGTMLAIADGGDQVAVYVLDAGCQVTDVRTAAVDPYDPEDMALGPDGTVWLADTGDNAATRPTVALLALRPDGSVAVYRLAYPDGPHDAEALLLAPDGTPYLVTKEVLGSSGVYRPVAQLEAAGTVGLVEVASVDLTLTGTEGGPVGRAGQLLVTGGAVARDGHALAVRTYTDAYVWPLAGSDVAGALAGDPVRVALPPSPQGEAISFSADGRALVVAGEGLPGDVTVLPVPAGTTPAETSATADGPPTDVPTEPEDGTSAVAAAAIAALAAAALLWLAGRFRRRGN